MSIGQTFHTHSVSSTMDSDDNINAHVKVYHLMKNIHIVSFLGKFNLSK
jgi:hypothetical protein